MLLFAILFLTNCATYKAKYENDKSANDLPTTKEISHTLYLIGDAGISPLGGMNPTLKQFKKRLGNARENSMAIFLGDNIYPAGLPDKKDSTVAYITAKSHLEAQLQTLEKFKGKPLFIPGNHDWYTQGLEGLERQQEYVQKRLNNKKAFLPEDGCPIEEIELGEDLIVIAIDTEWYLTNWDKRPDMNAKCDIKSREKFFTELEDAIKDNRGKTTILALHHPMFSYGPHGGQYSFRKQFYPKKMAIPLPVLGSFINVLRRTTGTSIADMQNKLYRELKKRVVTLAQQSDKVIFVSGHEHSLQYIVEENTPQIVSGSGAKIGKTRLLNGSKFSTGENGYAVLEVYKDGSSRVRYYGVNAIGEEKFLFTSQVLPPDRVLEYDRFEDQFYATATASVYTDDEINKSGFYKFLWGDRYRKYYGTKVTVPTVSLDTLFGGLTPIQKGGGHQSKSLRLRHKSGKEYVMRALRKSAELYLQSMAFKDQYVVGDFEDTYTEDVLSDFYTGAHPYAPFTLGPLSDAVGIYHTNPRLYYVPKQPALEDFNIEFGNELYMIEEHVSDGHGDLASFGFANKIGSTDDLIENLRDDEKYSIDMEAYIRARLFDMMIGDWDRHIDQWRWAEFKNKETGNVVYKPIPRDRDQVYSLMGDGALMSLATRIIPALSLMEGFNKEIRSVKGFNSSPKTFSLDMVVLPQTDISLWEEQAAFIQKNITEAVIDKALLAFPKEVQDPQTMARIKKVLLARKDNLVKTARAYYSVINKFGVVTGTDKDDYFTINKRKDGSTEVIAQRIKDGEKAAIFFKKTYNSKYTGEIWVYGLDDDDVFEVEGDNETKIRIVGGQNNDVYKILSKRGVHIYDYKDKDNTYDESGYARIHKSNDYHSNTYLFSDLKNSNNQIIPAIGFNPDDGVRIGFTNVYTYNGFRQNPFTSQHTIDAAFYFATTGFDVGYKGEFAHLFQNWNLEIETRATSPNFSDNFFGLGNETINRDDELDLDFNRVKIRKIQFAPSVVWRGRLGGKFRTGVSYEKIDVENTEDRFINTFYQQNNIETENNFLGVDAQYTYENTDNAAFPTMGMATSLHFGYKMNTNGDESFGYIIPSLSFDYKLIPSGKLVLATKWKAHFTVGDEYQFYQGATIGASDGPRGFRNERFTGKKSYYQLTDIRYSLAERKTGLLPVSTGIYGGFDYGRIWLPTDNSDIWHTSYGGGFFFNGADILTASFALFNSEDGLRFAFGIGFGF